MGEREFVSTLAEAIRAVSLGIATEAQARDALLKWLNREAPARAEAPAPPRNEVAINLFRYWQSQCDHPRAKATPERLRAINARLREGYKVEDIKAAINGAATSPFIDDKGKRFDDITLICRNGSKLESFIERSGTTIEEIAMDKPQGESAEVRALRTQIQVCRKRGDVAGYERANERLRKALSEVG